MLFLLWVSRQYKDKLKKGDVFNLYLIVYPVIRFSLDFLRLDASKVFSININQTLSAVVAIGAIAVLIWRHRGSMPENEMVEVSEMGPLVTETTADVDVPESKPTVRKPAARKSAGVAGKKPAAKKSSPRKPASKKETD